MLRNICQEVYVMMYRASNKINTPIYKFIIALNR